MPNKKSLNKARWLIKFNIPRLMLIRIFLSFYPISFMAESFSNLPYFMLHKTNYGVDINKHAIIDRTLQKNATSFPHINIGRWVRGMMIHRK